MRKQKKDMLMRGFVRPFMEQSRRHIRKQSKRKICPLCGSNHYHSNSCCSAEHFKLWKSGVVWTDQEKKDHQQLMRPKVPDMMENYPTEEEPGPVVDELGMKAVLRYEEDTRTLFTDIYKDGKVITSSQAAIADVPDLNGTAYTVEVLREQHGTEYPLLDTEESEMIKMQEEMAEPVSASMGVKVPTEEGKSDESRQI